KLQRYAWYPSFFRSGGTGPGRHTRYQKKILRCGRDIFFKRTLLLSLCQFGRHDYYTEGTVCLRGGWLCKRWLSIKAILCRYQIRSERKSGNAPRRATEQLPHVHGDNTWIPV